MRHPRNALLLCALYVFFTGCQSTKDYAYLAQDTRSYTDKKITSLTLKNGDVVIFDKIGGRYSEEKRDSGALRQFIGFDQAGQTKTVDFSRVLEVQCQKSESDPGGTILAATLAGGVILFVALLQALSHSSWN